MSEFSKIWDNEVKALAKACVTELKLVELMMKGDAYELTKEEKAYLEEVGGKYFDPYGMYYISNLIWRIEHTLADVREWQASIADGRIFYEQGRTLIEAFKLFEDVVPEFKRLK